MANRKKKGTKDNPATLQDIAVALKDQKEYIIKEASIHDDFCHYSYDIINGIGEGRTIKSTNKSNIIGDSLRKAFSKLIVHLACIDDVFKNNGIEIDDIDQFHNHELTGLYHVTGFKVKGGQDNESVILIGSKYVSTSGGRIEIESPKIPLDNLSSYKWYNELKTAFTKAREQVELYHEGEYTMVEVPEVEEKKPSATQLTIGDVIEEETHSGDDSDFENAKVE